MLTSFSVSLEFATSPTISNIALIMLTYYKARSHTKSPLVEKKQRWGRGGKRKEDRKE